MTSLFDTITGLAATSLWKCQEASGDLADSVGGRTLVAGGSGASYRVSGIAAGAPYGVSIPSTATFTAADHAGLDLADLFTFVFAIRKTVANSLRVLYKGDLATTPGYAIQNASDRMRLYNGDASTATLRQTAADTALTWEMMAFVRNGASSKFYLGNGVDDTTVSSATAMTDNNASLIVGGSGVTWELGFLALWDGVALTQANVQTIYAALGNADAVSFFGSGSLGTGLIGQ